MLSRLALLQILCIVHQVVGQNANALYTKYDGYSAADFDNVTGIFTPTEQDCLAIATVSPMINGIVYQNSSKTCKVLDNPNNMIIIRLRVNPTWNVHVKDISNIFVPIFISYAAQTTSTMVMINLWSSGTNTITDYSAALLDNCTCNYRNPMITQLWNVSQVQLYYNVGKMKVASLVHDGKDSTNINWFGKANLLKSTPYDMQTIRLGTFQSPSGYSLHGNANQWFGEMYLGNGGSGSCVNDMFYMSGAGYKGCASYAQTKTPYFIYSYSMKYEKPGSGYAAGFADRVVITAKVLSRVVFI